MDDATAMAPVEPQALMGKRHDMVQNVWEKMKEGWVKMGISEGFEEARVPELRAMFDPMIAQGDDAWAHMLEQVDIQEHMFDATPFGSASSTLPTFNTYAPAPGPAS